MMSEEHLFREGSLMSRRSGGMEGERKPGSGNPRWSKGLLLGPMWPILKLDNNSNIYRIPSHSSGTIWVRVFFGGRTERTEEEEEEP